MRLLDLDLATLLPADWLDQYTVRSHDDRIHASAVCADLARIANRGEAYNPASPMGRALHFLKGLAFEDLLGARFAERTHRCYRPNGFRPGEIVMDGIVGTPDFVDVEPNPETGEADLIVDEAKATALSSRTDMEGPKTLYWRWQGKTYCCLTGARRCRWWILHLAGDYLFDKSPEQGPQLKVYEATYTDQELAEHWAMILQHAATMRAQAKE